MPIKNKLLLFATTQISLADITVRERRHKTYDSIYMKFKNNSLIVIGFRVVVT